MSLQYITKYFSNIRISGSMMQCKLLYHVILLQIKTLLVFCQFYIQSVYLTLMNNSIERVVKYNCNTLTRTTILQNNTFFNIVWLFFLRNVIRDHDAWKKRLVYWLPNLHVKHGEIVEVSWACGNADQNNRVYITNQHGLQQVQDSIQKTLHNKDTPLSECQIVPKMNRKAFMYIGTNNLNITSFVNMMHGNVYPSKSINTQTLLAILFMNRIYDANQLLLSVLCDGVTLKSIKNDYNMDETVHTWNSTIDV